MQTAHTHQGLRGREARLGRAQRVWGACPRPERPCSSRLWPHHLSHQLPAALRPECEPLPAMERDGNVYVEVSARQKAGRCVLAVGGAPGQAPEHFSAVSTRRRLGVLWGLQGVRQQQPGGLPAGKGVAMGRWGHLEPGMGVTKDTHCCVL